MWAEAGCHSFIGSGGTEPKAERPEGFGEVLARVERTLAGHRASLLATCARERS
jgi:hypothetical protein